jgi:hypothetical protein
MKTTGTKKQKLVGKTTGTLKIDVDKRFAKLVKGSKNFDLITEFYFFCLVHPELRFWQSLRSWAGAEYIYKGKYDKEIDDIVAEDTFYFTGKEK